MLAQIGSIVTLEYYKFEPENGFVPEPLFDLSGKNTSLIIGWGNYLPGLHQLIEGCTAGDVVENISIDAGWGERRNDLLFRVTIKKLQKLGIQASNIIVGSSINLKGSINVLIASIEDDIVLLDANHPLAGSSYSCSFKIQDIESFEVEKGIANYKSRYQMSTFALGCFWGAELCYMRIPGVVGTRVGYSQGTTLHPTYEEVCQGATKHREVVQVVYDAHQVSYQALVDIAMDRLRETLSPLHHNLFDNDSTEQYRHGFVFHSDEQRSIAQQTIDTNGHFGIELLHASQFWEAEETHQKYLYKGGQSARKGTKEKIRCFG
jgi:peptide-methionine (S)-S-oxide reductase